MDKTTLDKIKAEKALDWQGSAALEHALEAQSPLKTLVASLEDPSPSLAWRSQLNEKLVAVSVKRKRKSLVPWIGGLAAAAACVSALFIFSPNKQTVVPEKGGSFEAALTKAYTQSVETTPIEEELAENFEADQDL